MMIFKFRTQTPEPAPACPVPPPEHNNLNKIVGDIAHQASGLGKESADLNGVIEDIAASSARQAETFKTLIDAIEIMVQANHAISDATASSNGSVRHARDMVEQIGQGVIGVKDKLQEVAAAAEDITQIALQTRLVAFNAIVEARRAGDAGRGFAVVADAVKDLAAKVEQSSKMIVNAVTQLSGRIEELASGINPPDNLKSEALKATENFHTAVGEVERGVQGIDSVAKENLSGCARVLETVSGLSKQVDSTAAALQNARKKTEGFLTLSETMIEMTAETGIETADTRFIEAAMASGEQIMRLFDEGLRSGQISEADLFDKRYQPIAGSNPEQFTTRYAAFSDRVLADPLDDILTWSNKVVFAVASDLNGYVATHNRKCSLPQGKDPVWNKANCRNRTFFTGRTEMAALKDQRRFLLQTYRRDMGGGKYVIMKHLSVPIWVNDVHWGALRIGYLF